MATSRFNAAGAIIALLALVAVLPAAEPDWRAIQDETIAHFTRILRMDTANPPGNETLVAEYVKSVFDKERIPAQLFARDPARANVVARLPFKPMPSFHPHSLKV